jgi:asparagine synthase (glutamine-hydrolysing)
VDGVATAVAREGVSLALCLIYSRFLATGAAMSALFLVRNEDPQFSEAALARARHQFSLQGSKDCSELEIPGWKILHTPYVQGGPDTLLVSQDGIVAIAGTLTCNGRIGAAALQALLDMPNLEKPDWSRIGGHFVAFVHRAGRSFLFTDYFGAFQLFHDQDSRLFSTSLLAAVDSLPRLSFHRQGLYELAFNVVPIGNDTVFQELKLLGPDRVVELGRGGVTSHAIAKPLPAERDRRPVREALEANRDRLLTVLRPYAEAFQERIFCALSGGMDSRLVLAGLRGVGASPGLFVYGDPGDDDVVVAKAIAEAEGTQIDWWDKQNWRHPTLDEFPEQVERNFQAYDGLAPFGALFENGANDAARIARHRGGALSASGGCGEIYRNFFFLPDRAFRAADVARVFFARYRVADMTPEFDEVQFLRGLEDKILESLSCSGERKKLPRQLVEQVYPRIRCRSAFGREISLEARDGAYVMPFLDHHVVAEAVKLPLRLKNAGAFESQLLAMIDPGLAAHPSVYGHDFLEPPSRSHRFSEWNTRIRPIWLRQRSYALQRRRGPMEDEHGGLISRDYIGSVVDLEFPVMRRFFRTEQITDSSLMRRIANLEYFASYLGSKLAN